MYRSRIVAVLQATQNASKVWTECRSLHRLRIETDKKKPKDNFATMASESLRPLNILTTFRWPGSAFGEGIQFWRLTSSKILRWDRLKQLFEPRDQVDVPHTKVASNGNLLTQIDWQHVLRCHNLGYSYSSRHQSTVRRACKPNTNKFHR